MFKILYCYNAATIMKHALLSVVSVQLLLLCVHHVKGFAPSLQSVGKLKSHGLNDVALFHQSTSLHVSASSEETKEEETAKPVVEVPADPINDVSDNLQLLQDSLWKNSTMAAQLVDQISKMRQSEVSRETMDQFLDTLLEQGPDKKYPFWTRSKRMAKLSRRSRMASLSRTITLTTPPASESETLEGGETKESLQQRRRRAFVSVLRSLVELTPEDTESGIPAIVVLEKKALKATKANADELRKRMPDGLESPKYDIISTLQAGSTPIEVRKYEPFAVCAVGMAKPRPADQDRTDAKIQNPEMGGASSFGALAGYLFGKNDQSTAMKMTTPVITSPETDRPNEKQMAFVLPSEFWDEANLLKAPQPLNGSGVSLQRKAEETRATLMFGGYASKPECDKRKQELAGVLGKSKEWALSTDDFSVSQYNDPFTPPWRRLNEVSIRVTPK